MLIPEIGHLAMWFAFGMALALAVIPQVGSYAGWRSWMSASIGLSHGVFLTSALAFGVLVYGFVMDDFSVAYIAKQSNSAMPWYFKVSALWGGHEGSLLLWILVLALWISLVAGLSQHLPLILRARILSVLGMISIGFLAFTGITSNPFERTLPNVPLDGADLNPLLQDVGLIFHPPLLYVGYVGFSVAFAFAVAALQGGRLDAAWARWTRPWTTAAWVFMTLGIALGSWWAYYELGWGGWWFWDPVENASLMPWLAGTALVHSLAVTEKRGGFRAWTVLLAISAFCLSLLGTFLVRSGVLTSVHSFASDPERGRFILYFLAIVIGGSLTLYAARAGRLKSVGAPHWFSREGFLLSNNLLLVVAALMVLLGTLYPLVIDALGMGRISVGPPYFNTLFAPLAVVLFGLMAIGPMAPWSRPDSAWIWRSMRWVLLATAILTALVGLGSGEFKLWSSLGVAAAFWVALGTLTDVWMRVRGDHPLARLKRLGAGYHGMVVAHLGVAVLTFGVAMVSGFNQERDLRMQVGDSAELGGYRFEFERLETVAGPNWDADQAVINIYRSDRLMRQVTPQKRRYRVSGQVMTEAGIYNRWDSDLFVAMGEPLDDAWAIRLRVKPFINFLWLGSFIMAVGGAIAMLDRRYRVRLTARAAVDGVRA
ncbi:heme lyase CcmF/NrfE family subunit [Litorivicinus lipolyticus]|uniref:heme lyase CcmF/NrfE family subunit n=1 Tax=Litorivicinus lipolyticus TaxID=418701 RepID=UPI003B5BCFC0